MGRLVRDECALKAPLVEAINAAVADHSRLIRLLSTEVEKTALNRSWEYAYSAVTLIERLTESLKSLALFVEDVD